MHHRTILARHWLHAIGGLPNRLSVVSRRNRRCAATVDHAFPFRPYAPFQYCASISGTMIRAAASIKARCENACGKFPRWRPVPASNSSA